MLVGTGPDFVITSSLNKLNTPFYCCFQGNSVQYTACIHAIYIPGGQLMAGNGCPMKSILHCRELIWLRNVIRLANATTNSNVVLRFGMQFSDLQPERCGINSLQCRESSCIAECPMYGRNGSPSIHSNRTRRTAVNKGTNFVICISGIKLPTCLTH